MKVATSSLASVAACALLLAACTESSNPVIPENSDLPGGHVVRPDGGGPHDTSPSEVTIDTGGPRPCDLLGQTGCLLGEGCYPRDGVAFCDGAGDNGPLGDCAAGPLADEQQTRCEPGLTCIPHHPLDPTGQCLPLCDPLDHSAPCAAYDGICHALPGFTGRPLVGYCGFYF